MGSERKKKKNSNASLSIKTQLDKIEKYFKKIKSEMPELTKEQANNPEIAFAISLKSKSVSRDWSKVEENLATTLRSIFNNTDQNFRIVIAGHEKPEIDELTHERVTWLPVTFEPPVPPLSGEKFTFDKKHKRRVIGAYLRKTGFSGYFMPIDADDWIHYRFVEFIRLQPITKAFVLNKGIMVNELLNEAWLRNRFYIGCGSSALYYFRNHDLPISSELEDAEKTLFGLSLKNHMKVTENLDAVQIDYMKVDYQLVTYVLGHGDNTSVIKGKKSNLVSAKNYKTQGENLENWFYNYFKIKNT